MVLQPKKRSGFFGGRECVKTESEAKKTPDPLTGQIHVNTGEREKRGK